MNNSEIYLNSSFQACKKLTNNFSTSFSMGIYFLGKKIRNPIYSIYGFVRVADEIVDTFFDIDEYERSPIILLDFTFLTSSTGTVLTFIPNSFNRYEI